MDDGGLYEAAQREAGAALSAALSSRTLGCAGALAATGAGYGLFAARDLGAGEAFLCAHELCFTCRGGRAALSSAEGAAARATLAAVGATDDEDAAWRHAEAPAFPPSPQDGCSAGDAHFALPCAVVLRLRHTEAAASLGVAPLPAAAAAVLGLRHGGCVVWTRRPVAAGEEVTRDAAPGRRTLSRAAALLQLLHPPRWAAAAERDALAEAVAAAATAAPPPPPPARQPQPQPAPLADPTQPVRVFTDYALLAEELRALGSASRASSSLSVEVAASAADGVDVLWLNQPLRDFAALPRGLWVNQFPYEGCLVRKDLLPQTCRAAASAAAGWPPWAPPSYDLATEAAAFLAAHAEAGGDGVATWVIKRAGGTHSADAAVTRCAACVARHALARQLPGGDRVAQRHCDAPALLKGRKFDVRVYVAVRSFFPLEAAVDARYYGRVASAPWRDDDASLADFATHFTVSWYNSQSAASSSPSPLDEPASPPLLGRQALEAAAAAEGYDWAAADVALRLALRELFAAAGDRFVGPFHPGRALYGCDVLFERAEAAGGGGVVLLPKLLEVNFCGDLATLLTRVPGGAPAFVADVFRYLFAGQADAEGHLQPL